MRAYLHDGDGTPHFWGEDTTRPRVTQLVWTGNGGSPTGVTVDATTLVVCFTEAIHDPTLAGIPHHTSAHTLRAKRASGLVRRQRLRRANLQCQPARQRSLHLEHLRRRQHT